MPEPSLPLPSDDPADDLPRTFRRERDAQAREREKQEREERKRERSLFAGSDVPPPPAATITHIDVPFPRLVMFFLKAAVAAVPAFLLLGVLLLIAGTLIAQFDPSLVPIQIRFGYK